MPIVSQPDLFGSIIYEIVVYDGDGNPLHRISDMLALSYTKEVNNIGLASFELPGNHVAIDDLTLDTVIGIVRLPKGVYDYGVYDPDFWGLWRGERRYTDAQGYDRYVALCVSSLHLLDRAIIAYPANTDRRTKFTQIPPETIAKELVTLNCTTAGTVLDGRAREPTIPGITVDGDNAVGEPMDLSCAWNKLLPTLQKIALIGTADFDLVRSGTGWVFCWYPGQLGTDRRDSVVFSLGFGNMINPQLTYDRTRERTVAIIGGRGEEDNREVAVINSQPFVAETNDAELFVDARQFTTTKGLESQGDIALMRAALPAQLNFDVLQTPGSSYGTHYFLGDIITARYKDIVATKQIVRVTIQWDQTAQERIRIETQDLLSSVLAIPRVRASEDVSVITSLNMPWRAFSVGDNIAVAESDGVLEQPSEIDVDDSLSVADTPAVNFDILIPDAAEDAITVEATLTDLHKVSFVSESESVSVSDASHDERRSEALVDASESTTVEDTLTKIESVAFISESESANVAATPGVLRETAKISKSESVGVDAEADVYKPPWWTGYGAIDEDKILEHRENISASTLQQYGGGTSTAPYWVFIRTTYDNADGYLWYTPQYYYGQFINYEAWYGGYFIDRSTGTSTSIRDLSGSNPFLLTGDHVYAFRQFSDLSLILYRDNVEFRSYVHTNVLADTTSGYGPWPEIIRAVVVVYGHLDSAQMTALFNAMQDL